MAKLRHYQLSPQAEQVLSLSAAHEHNLFALRETSQWQDMVFYAIVMLPFAQALELALTFVSCVYERELMQEQRMLFQQARQWRANGGDPLRHELFEQAQALGFDNPISCLVLSIFWSEGSMTPAGLEAVFPQPWQAPLTLANTLCLILHGYSEKPDLQACYLGQFVQLTQEQFNRMPLSQDTGRRYYLYNDITVPEGA
ncbi:hypothetical protein SME10J_41340 [Serratia marcescens]|nr:hypothetical protein SME10J_41340 [Serratia marcescens]